MAKAADSATDPEACYNSGMASPFPGMDPFLERHWFDLHAQLVTLAGTALNKSLPDDLVARVDERVAADKLIDPRIFDAEERTERYIAVTQVEGGELVTVLEVFSAATKLPGEDRERYLQRRAAWLASGANVVEVDLLRAGSWRELLSWSVPPAAAGAAYRAIVRRNHHRQQRVELYPISLKDRLPTLSIPLRTTDRDVKLGLQSLLDQAYEDGRYDRTRYNRELEGGFDADDQKWIDELLRSAGKR